MTGAHLALRHALPMFVLAGLCLASLDATAKYLVRDHPVLLVLWARYAGQMVAVTPYAWRRAGDGFWRTGRLRMQLLRSLFLVGATATFFTGLRYLPLAEASAITFMAPILVVALSLPVLGERPTRPRVVASAAGFLGILLLVRPGAPALQPAAGLLVCAALCNALYQLYTRKLRDENPHTMLFYSALVGTVLITAALPFALEASVITGRDAILLMLSGVFAGVGHGLLIAAFARAPAALLAPFTYLQIAWAVVFGVAVFGQHPDGASATGIAIVIGSGVLLAVWERRRARLL